MRDIEIWVNLNGSRNDNPHELLQTVTYLRVGLKRVKEDNKHILKAQEQLNNVLLTKLHSNEKEKNKELKLNMEITTPYKCKVRKMEFSKNETESSSEESAKHETEKYKDSSESGDSNQKKNKYKSYEEISGEFKKMKHPMFNIYIKKEKEKSSLSGMKKYFHIYNYFDELKAKMAIYNLTRKLANIWWQDIKKVKGIKNVM